MISDILQRAERAARMLKVHPSGRVSVGVPGQRRALSRGIGLSFHEHREYQFGDDVRRLDWNVTARLGKPFIKVFDQEQAGSALVVFDTSASVTGWPTKDVVSDLGREIAAAVILACARADERVGLLAFSDRAEASVPVNRGFRHAQQLARLVATSTFPPRGTDFDRLCHQAASSLPKRGLVVIVSDFLGHGLAQGLTHLAPRHEVVAIVLRAAYRLPLPSRGLVRVADLETGSTRWIDAHDRDTRRQLGAADGARLLQLRALFRAHGVAAVEVDAARPYLPVLQRFWGVRHRPVAR